MIFSDLGFHAKEGVPDNRKVYKLFTHNECMLIETALSLRTTICHFKKVFRRTWEQFWARLAIAKATFNLLIFYYGSTADETGIFHLSIAQFSL